MKVQPDIVTFGNYRFDRSLSSGLQVGYKSRETEVNQSFVQPKFGVTSLRFTYGSWGEDLKYLVNTYHADEIVIWMNEIINGVGEQTEKRFDPYAGRKIELL